MNVCDRCKKLARPFCYGDLVNQSFQVMDLCPDCTELLSDLLFHYRNGNDLVVINSSSCEVSHD